MTARIHAMRLSARRGIAMGGHTRLLQVADGSIAVAMPRETDWELVPAWLQNEARVWCWGSLAEGVRNRTVAQLIERGRLMGLAVAPATGDVDAPAAPFDITGAPLAPATRPKRAPRVVDLSALWAGPLCAHLLRRCGAEVIKVESRQRPDGARLGNQQFFESLNRGKQQVTLDFASDAGLAVLRALINSADVVVESSRPRALRQLGIHAEAMLHEHPNLTWVSITGYGRENPFGNWVAFGDDAGVAGGLSRVMRDVTGEFQFVGDAIADPLTGIHAAVAAWRSWCGGGGRLISLALTNVAAWCLADAYAHRGKDTVRRAFLDWWRAQC